MPADDQPSTAPCSPAARWASCPRWRSSAAPSFRPSFIAPRPARRRASISLSAADILVIRDVAVPDLLAVVAARRREGRLTVFEPGARLFAPASTNAGGDLAARSLAPQLARLADGVQVGGFGLEAQLDAVNPRRARFPEPALGDAAARTARPRRRPGHRLDRRRGRARRSRRRAPGAGRRPRTPPRRTRRRSGGPRGRRGPVGAAQRAGDAGGDPPTPLKASASCEASTSASCRCRPRGARPSSPTSARWSTRPTAFWWSPATPIPSAS